MLQNSVLVVSNDREISHKISSIMSKDYSQPIFSAPSFEKALITLAKEKCSVLLADNDLYTSHIIINFLRQVKSLWPDIIRVLIVGNNNIDNLDTIINGAEIFRVCYKNWNRNRLYKTLKDSISHYTSQKHIHKLTSIVQTQNFNLQKINKILEEKIINKTEEIIEINDRLSVSLLATVQALSQAVEAKDILTKGHSERVAQFCIYMASEMNFSEDEINGLRMAALLHDVGKIGISENILLKPDKLSSSELTIIQQHPIIGYKIVEPIPFGWDVAKVVLQHHEYFNGKGYPYGIKGKEISIGARILNVADAFDAMTCDRPYRLALSKFKALEEIKTNTGNQFDPDVVNIFLKLFSLPKTNRFF